MTARARVQEVLAAASRLADETDPLGREARERLPETTGLSKEGVALALETSLEITATDDEMESLLSSVAEAARVIVVLSANVVTAASRAIALARAASKAVIVRPSRREQIFAELLVRALGEAGVSGVSIVSELQPRPGDHLHVYGRDATITRIREESPDGVSVWGHGAGFGIAAIDAQDSGAAEALAEDVVLFDQRGCLSPRFALFRGDEASARSFARDLAEALSRRAESVPVGAVDEKERAALRAYVDAMTLAGEVMSSRAGTVSLDLSPKALLLPPLPRVVHVARVADDRAALDLLRPTSSFVTAIGGSGALATSLSHAMTWARRSELSAMQRPRLDGPVDRRSPAPRTRL